MDDLKAAFAGEAQANRRYTAFAKKADEEGYPQVAKLFRAAAHGETVHALSHFKVMGEIKSTAENLKTAIAGETYEFTTMYPDFIKDAVAEQNTPANVTFSRANDVEKIHAALYSEALENLGKPAKHSIITSARFAATCKPARHPSAARSAMRWGRGSKRYHKKLPVNQLSGQGSVAAAHFCMLSCKIFKARQLSMPGLSASTISPIPPTMPTSTLSSRLKYVRQVWREY